jgi:predicted amidohydrolase YtcJ
MQTSRRTTLGLLAAAPFLGGASSRPIIIYTSKFITMDSRQPIANHVAVADGMVVAVGQSLSDIKAAIGDREALIDERFAKRVLMPGFIDPHVHPMQSAIMLNLPFVAPEGGAGPIQG